MFYIFILLFALYFVLTLASIVAVLQEDIYYSKKQKLQKVVFILFIPIVASIVELRRLNTFASLKKETYKEDVDQNARVYKFVDDSYPPIDVSSSSSESGSL